MLHFPRNPRPPRNRLEGEALEFPSDAWRVFSDCSVRYLTLLTPVPLTGNLRGLQCVFLFVLFGFVFFAGGPASVASSFDLPPLRFPLVCFVGTLQMWVRCFIHSVIDHTIEVGAVLSALRDSSLLGCDKDKMVVSNKFRACECHDHVRS